MQNFGKICVTLGFVVILLGCKTTYDEKYLQYEQEEVICTWSKSEWLTKGGLKICPNNRRCSDAEMIPYQPCVQPMPKYYNDVNLGEGDVELIHPYTRTVVLCMEKDGGNVLGCVERFKNEGYVLITDIPQLPAKYDTIVKGNYPSRRWGGDRGQTVPRW